MSVTVTQELTQQTVTVTGNPVENNATVTVSNARGPAGPTGEGGVSTFAALTDKVTANLPTINTPLASALSGKAATSHTHTASQISDSTATGRSLLTAATQSDARTTALGSGATGDALFTAASPAIANAILSSVKIATADDNRIATVYADDSELFVSLGVGSWLVDLRLLWGIAGGANIAYRLQFTGVISTAVPIGHQLVRSSVNGQPLFNTGYTETVNNSCHGALLLLNVTTAGTFKIDHRNNNATGTSIRRAGSAIIAKKIA
jgi:hypothetical protein